MDKLSRHATEALRRGMTYGQYMAKYHPSISRQEPDPLGKTCTCVVCGKVFYTTRSDKKYCSDFCRTNNPNPKPYRPAFTPPDDYPTIDCALFAFDKEKIITYFVRSPFTVCSLNIGELSVDSFINCVHATLKRLHLTDTVHVHRYKCKIFVNKS